MVKHRHNNMKHILNLKNTFTYQKILTTYFYNIMK